MPQEKSIYPKPKARLVWSVIAVAGGVIAAIAMDAWWWGAIFAVLGVVGIFYNWKIMKSGKTDKWSS